MKLIINCSVLKSAGGMQVALSIVKECIKFHENDYHIFVTQQIMDQIIESDFTSNFHFYFFKFSPSSIRNSIWTIRKLKKLEREIKPDCVFTVFGPSYWTPKSPHLIGYAVPHYVYPEYYKKIKLSFKDRQLFLLKKYLYLYLFKKNGDFYYTETKDVSRRLSKLLNRSEERIVTIGNTYNYAFEDPDFDYNLVPPREKKEFRLVTISTYNIHKNFEIIEEVIPFLSEADVKVKFILTLDEKIFEHIFKNGRDCIINVGPVPLKMCPYLYSISDALFLPTFLECFSASYPEAMKMKKPILTSDLSFAREICGDSAIYFDPWNPQEIANKIINLVKRKDLQKELILRGEQQLEQFETPYSRTHKLLEACSNISKCQKVV